MSKKELIENLEEQLLTLERLLYTINKVKAQTNEEYDKYEKEFAKIRGDYKQVFNLYEKKADKVEDIIEEFAKKFIEENDEEQIKNFLKIIYKLSKTCVKIIKIHKLTKEKEEIIKSLKYILPIKEVKSHEEILDGLLSEEKIESIAQYLKYLQKIILNDFTKQLTDIDDYKQGEDFKFLVHSISLKEYDKEKQEKETVSSLITQRHTKTYGTGYGFIMAPKNIIYTSTTAQSEDDLSAPILPRIDSIQKMEDECTNYSEVLLEGFNPIGIFCLTDGSKGLNLNYKKAKKLKEMFPSLPLVDIDLTLYKGDLTEIRNSLIKHINARIGIYDEVNYEEYEGFFKKYLKLKANREITEEDILELFTSYQKSLTSKKTCDKL